MAKIKIKHFTTNEKLLDKYVRHAVYVEQLKKGEARRISTMLAKDVFPEMRIKLLASLTKIVGIRDPDDIRLIPFKRIINLIAANKKIAIAGMVKAEKVLINRLTDIAKYEADWNSNTLKKAVPLDIDIAMPSTEVLRQLVTSRPFDGHKLGTWMSGYSTSMQMGMAKQLKIGIAAGEGIPKLAKRIDKVFGIKTRQAETIARTATANVVYQAREEVFKKNTDLVRKVQFVATLDDRTTLECINYDGQVFDVGDGPRPPLHFNCRSTVIPITTSWQEYGVEAPPGYTRAGKPTSNPMDGSVPSKLTYKEWLKNQGATAEGRAVQDRVLGKAKAEMFRTGQVTIDKFIGKDLKPLTLKQLATREGIVLPAPPPTTVNVYRNKAGQRFPDNETLKIIHTADGNTQMVVRATGEKVTLDIEASGSGIAKRIPEATSSNVGTTFTNTASKEFRESVEKQIAAYPEKVKKLLNDNGISYKAGSNLTEMFPELKGTQPRGWPAGSTWDPVRGIFHYETKSIAVVEKYTPLGSTKLKSMSNESIKGVLNHETGHGFNRTISGGYSSTTEFKTAYTNDLRTIGTVESMQKKGIEYFYQGGSQAGRDETFAEVFADLMGTGSSDKNVSQYFPNCKVYIEDLLK